MLFSILCTSWPYAVFYDVRNAFNLVYTVPAQPLLDDCNDAFYIVGDVIGAQFGRNLKSRKDRAKNVVFQMLISRICLHTRRIAKGGPVHTLVVPNKPQDMEEDTLC